MSLKDSVTNFDLKLAVKDTLYKYLPVSLQNAAVSIYGFYWQQRRFGGVFPKELKAFRERNTFTEAEWEEYQAKELRKLLVHAFKEVPFYKEKCGKAGLKLTDLANFELKDLVKLPFLEKEELRQFGTSSLMAERGIRSNCIVAGFMETSMTSVLDGDKIRRIKNRTAQKKLTSLESVAGTVSFLLSDKSKSITGSNIFVDSGTL